ncbi:hypothetical protein J5N97_029846 [Dioscorea zingiberensis]|uniref:Scarecrow-like protein 6 n=1 Tax=Dioscorea zingiberensis TaxID=325984 RepID=A0A9D5BWL4_9LILI|nr:hypothetical protein J5N97_029846 [Dioscorea zingiberensis]
MPFNIQGKGLREATAAAAAIGGEGGGVVGAGGGLLVSGVKRSRGELEPRSVLDHRRSPSPPTSTSTLSSSLGGGGGSSDTAGVAALSDTLAPQRKWPPSPADRRDDWPADLQPIPEKGGVVLAAEDWETMLSDPAASPGGQEQTFLRWIMADIDDPLKQQLLSQNPPDLDSSSAAAAFGFFDPTFGFDPMPGIGATPPVINPGPSAITPVGPQLKVPNFAGNSVAPPAPQPLSLPPGMFFHESMEEKPLVFTPSQNPSFFLPDPHHQLLIPPQPKRHHPINPQPPLPPYQLQPQRSMKPKLGASADEQQQQQQQALFDQLFKAAELVESGNSVGARGILARLNHQLPPSPLGKPLLRSAFYFRDALNLLLSASPPSRPPPLSTPLDVVLKLSAFKSFSEVSPILQFTNFTSIQALLEELAGSDRIHVIDFDIGVGGQWSSFMQELAQRRSTVAASSPILKITAFVSPNSYHPLELHLTRENLSHFAADLNIPFEFNAMNLESFDPVSILGMSQDEAIAVNLPVGSALGPSIPTIFRLVKQLSPKIVISVDHGCDRSDLSFSHHFVHCFQSSMVLLDSIDAAGTSPEVANKIERFLLQPRIESAVLGRHRSAEKMLTWRTLFASAGFVPLQFSNFTETQAECLLKRVQVRGFHVEKRHSSLSLYWQRGELVSVSVWRC